MKHFSLLALLLSIGCATGCKDDSGREMPTWEGSYCDHVDGGVKCEGVFIGFDDPKFKKLWITDSKGVYCLMTQFINNVDAWDDPSKKCDYEESK